MNSRRRIRAWSLVLMPLLCAAPCQAGDPPPAPPQPAAEVSTAFPWPQYGGGPDRNAWRERSDSVRVPRVRWFVPDVHGQPTFGHGALYSAGKQVLRIDPDNGNVLARFTPPQAVEGMPASLGGAPVLAPERVVVRTWDNRLFGLTPDLSSVAWKRDRLGSSQEAAPHPGLLVGQVYVCAGGNDVEALDVASGESLWRVMLEGRVDVAPVAFGERVAVATTDGTLVALELATGRRAWTTEHGASFAWSSPVVGFGVLLLADRGGSDRTRPSALNAFALADGQRLWSTPFGATGFSLPGIGSDRVIGGFGRSVALFHPKTGAMEETPRIRTGINAFGSPTQVGDTLLFGNLDGHLYAHDRVSGDLRWAFRLPLPATAGSASGAPPRESRRPQVGDFVHTGERIYVSTQLGLFCLEQDPDRKQAPPGYVLEWK